MRADGSIFMFVDDDPASRRLMAKLFERHRAGDELVCASSGQDAIALARVKQPQVVLLDLNLTDMSGEDVLEALKSEIDASVVVVSGETEEETQRRLIERGASDYLIKPFKVPELFALIDSLVA